MNREVVILSGGGAAAAVEGSAFCSHAEKQIPRLRDRLAVAPLGMTAPGIRDD